MFIYPEQVTYDIVKEPKWQPATTPVDLTDETIHEHKEKVLLQMEHEKFDTILIYGDREHGANFGYLSGFEPRFEEAVLVLHKTGEAYMLLGNESLRMNQYSRILTTAIHVPYFSLPNQPMENQKTFHELMIDSGIKPNTKVGIVGWKLFTSSFEDNCQFYDVPYFIVDTIKTIVGSTGEVANAIGLFISPEKGVRTTVNANEIAHYEFGASLASTCMLKMQNNIELGIREMDLAENLSAYGQPHTVQTICAAGERFTNAVVAPRASQLHLGDKFTSTTGFRGGLTNRSGYLAQTNKDLPAEHRDYLDVVVRPYFAAAATWYSSIGIGISGNTIYNAIEKVLPQKLYGWKLNPGHLTGSEEWMSSPIYSNSQIKIKSGMMLQMDIIVNVPDYAGSNAEDGVAIADELLRNEISEKYPQIWDRIMERRNYMIDELGIPLKPEVLPLSNTSGYLRPFLLEKSKALKIKL